MTHDLRFGLIGYGLWGTHHAQAIAATPGARLVAIADAAEANRAAASSAFPDATVSDNWRNVIARADVDVIDVVVPSHLHYEIGRAALEAGKHLFVEKPMVLEGAHADELIRLAKVRGRVLAVDHEMRQSRLWGRVRQLIEQGVVGTPQYALVELSRFPYRLGSEGWRYDIRRVGNWILEEPIHFIDLVRWYFQGFGDPISVFARASSRQPDRPELQDNFTTIVNFSHGGYGVVSQTLAAFGHHISCKLSGTQGAIWAYWSGEDARTGQPTFGLRYGTDEKVEEVKFEEVTGEIVELKQQIASLVQSVRDGTPPAATGEDGRWAVRLCLAAQQSVDRRMPVALEDSPD